jgi:hypothetical protein
LTREIYLKAIRKARESVEQNTLIDSDQFEQNAEKYWQSVTKGTSDLGAKLGAATMRGSAELGGRLNAAVKAALREFVAPHPKTNIPPETPNPEISNLEPKADEPILNAESVPIDERSQAEDSD